MLPYHSYSSASITSRAIELIIHVMMIRASSRISPFEGRRHCDRIARQNV
jgi:hypothetical protein